MCTNFYILCNCLSDVCVLHIPVFTDVFVLQTDASLRGVSGVLSVIRDGMELPVGFWSRQRILKHAIQPRNWSA